MVNDSEYLSVSTIGQDVRVIDELHRVNLWLIEGRDRAILFDTGFGFIDFHRLLPQLTTKPVMVLNSHIHPDHSFANNQFDVIYCGRFDEPRAHGVITEEDKVRTFYDFFQEKPQDEAFADGWNPGYSNKVIPLNDHEIIDLGDHVIEVIETPGHTIGSISLLDRKNRMLYSGDMVLTWQVWGQLQESSSLTVYLNSLQKMASLRSDYDYLAPGHTLPDTEYLLDAQIMDMYIDGVKRIISGNAQGVREHTFLGDGLCTMFEVGGMVYDPLRLQ